MSKAIIIEDELAAQQLLSNILSDNCPQVNVVDKCISLSESLTSLSTNNPDILFLDIELEDCTAFDILNAVEHRDFKIIFTTAYDEYALEAFKFEAVDYLLKPYSSKDVINAIEKVEKRNYNQEVINRLLNKLDQKSERNKIALSNSDGLVMVDVDNIMHIEADRSYCYVYEAGQNKMMISKPMIEIEKMLPQGLFFRSHASHIINVNHLRRYSYEDGGIAILNDGTQVPVSRRKKQEFLEFIKK